jgi:hypothetical protein
MSIKKPDTRSRILDAVLSLVADDPDTGLRMADICILPPAPTCWSQPRSMSMR